MTQSATVGRATGFPDRDSDPLDDIFGEEETRSRRRRGAAQPMQSVRRGAPVWPVAIVASLVWVAAVAAFCWSHYSLPPSLASAREVAGSRITTSDWLMIAAAILAPLLLIWLVAWLIRRSNEMRMQTQELANAALRLAHTTREMNSLEGFGLPSPPIDGELSEGTPRHLRREVERATHAISALHAQMRSIEEALSKQAAAIDDVAERAEARARRIGETLGAERAALASVVERLEQAQPAVADTAMRARAMQADAVDLSLAAGDDLSANAPTSDWLTHLGPGDPTEEAEEARILNERDTDDTAATVAVGAATVGAAVAALSDDDRGADPAALDPFDDIGSKKTEVEADRLSELTAAVVSQEPPFARARRHPVDWEKFVRAANFPESEDDSETLDALYEVLTDPEAASLLQSAEDSLAVLADLDLYMEDFARPLAPVSDWQAFLDGKADAARAKLGFEAPAEQARILSKFGSDRGFERLCGKFVERYEDILPRMVRESDKPELLTDLSDTRTGRAYLLVSSALQGLNREDRASHTG